VFYLFPYTYRMYSPCVLYVPHVCSFVDERVMHVSCGRSHTVCASASGRVFCWGENTHGQCGVIGPQIVVHPQHIPVVTHSDGNLKQLLSESCDSTMLTGDRDSSQRDGTESDVTGGMCSRAGCCHSRVCHASQSGCSGLLVNAKVVHVSCGGTHTAVLSICGKLWAWGTGIQVGIADCTSVPVPYPIEFPADRQVISVSCGGQHTVALTVRREANKFDAAAAVKETVKSGFGRTGSCTPDAGQNTSESIKLSNVPPEAKKGIARRSASNQQKTDSNIDTEECDPVLETENTATGVNIPMHNLSSSSVGDSGQDHVGNECDAECELVSTCIDDVYVDAAQTSNCDLPANVHSENSGSTGRETVDQSSADSHMQNVEMVRSTDASYTGCSNLSKSRSSFLDETEAIMFLEKQLSDTNSSTVTAENKSSKDRNLTKVERKDVQDVAPSMSPFAKTVESLLQHVPSSPVVQEYVSNLTRTVVSNLRTSVDRRLNYVTSQVELSMRGIASLNKVTEAGETKVNTALDDTALLERLALSTCVSSL